MSASRRDGMRPNLGAEPDARRERARATRARPRRRRRRSPARRADGTALASPPTARAWTGLNRGPATRPLLDDHRPLGADTDRDELDVSDSQVRAVLDAGRRCPKVAPFAPAAPVVSTTPTSMCSTAGPDANARGCACHAAGETSERAPRARRRRAEALPSRANPRPVPTSPRPPVGMSAAPRWTPCRSFYHLRKPRP
jgi:hypothetical protein